MSAHYHPNLCVSQNFLKDPRLVASLINRSSIHAEDVVYEIGPGKGIITIQLANRCKQVVAIEKDAALSSALRQKFVHQSNLTIHTGDFLSHPLPREPYKVFSNIPFNITSAIVARLTTTTNPPEDAYLVMQKEAAEMYLGKPYESLRSVLLQPWFKPEVMYQFQRSDFTPQPHVDTALLRICKRSPPLIDRSDRQYFRDFVVYGYTAWHSTLYDTFKTIFSYQQLKQIHRVLNIDLEATPTTLHFENWLSLFEVFKKVGSPQAAWKIAGSEERLRRQQRKLQKIHCRKQS
ncbi:MAG: 23S ribosomal RNA methyltransferase Erm [Chloroflexi bacterium]|nr:23S ribosomal RNA methyltransferase Erm [Chloroflexota bacterium]